MKYKVFVVHLLFIATVLLVTRQHAFAQKVGVVLSGGGANAMAHIGVLKALEENNIPIDYIAGSSMGAYIAALYAVGVSPAMMEKVFNTDEFRNMVNGKIEEKYKFYFKQRGLDASWITIKFSLDTLWQTSLPTALISPAAIDFEMMERLSGGDAAANYNFDSLFVPFRCVASDIEAKEQVIFKEGFLSEAIRASLAYPLYLKPITINGKLLFDGGIYNNFPADVMENDFHPDIIIGSNVSANFLPPNEDNLLSQLKNMLVSKTDYSIKNGVLIEPNISINLFDFTTIQTTIDSGYIAAINEMDTIKAIVSHRVYMDELVKKRNEFLNKKPQLIIDKINIDGLNKRQSNYVRHIFQKKKNPVSVEAIKPNYFKLLSDDKIKSIYPKARYNYITNLFDLHLNIKKEKDIVFDFGGNFSSRPINQAFVGVQYNYLGNYALGISANSYFGKLYGSTQLKARFDFPIKHPFYIEPEFTLNRWDYFKSYATFFEDVKPSFLVQNEQIGKISIGLPIHNKGKIITGITYAMLQDDYYQTKDFVQTDTADGTTFDLFSPFICFEHNTLNFKQYANAGKYLSIRGRYVEGEEYNLPGSTSSDKMQYRKSHHWYQFKIVYDHYYKATGKLRLGVYAEGVYSNQSLFNNYTSSILKASAFQPTPESKTLFLESFRSNQYVAIGKKMIFHLRKSIDFRLEGYAFQPYKEIIKQDDLSAKYGDAWEKRYMIVTMAGVYHSPIGPVSLSLNYYHNVPEVAREDRTPLTFLFHFGYVIFNQKALN